jgi:WD40 repeat protein
MTGGTELAKVDIATRKKSSTGLKAAHSGAGLIWSQPFSDGRLLAPGRSDGPLEVYGGTAPPLSLSGVFEADVIKLSPKEDQVVIGYGAIGAEPVTVIHNLRTSEVTPLFKNCQLSAVELVWAQGGDQLAYPIHADPPEVRIYNVKSGRTQVLLRPDTFAHLGSLSWSPDGRYLVVTQNAGEPESSVWAVSTDGTVRQRLVEGGLMPNWSPDGTHLLYARRQENGQSLDWYLLELQPVEFKKGGQGK